MGGAAAALIGVISLLGGCQTERITTSDTRPMPPKPRAAQPVPASAVANRMTLLVGQKPMDTNGNGFPDRIEVATTLFAWPNTTGMQARGTFEFTLYQAGKADDLHTEPLARWSFSGEEVENAVVRTMWGTGYNFKLSLLRARGSDELPAMRGDLRGRFISEDPSVPPVECSPEVRLVQLGRNASTQQGRTIASPR